MCSTVRIVCLCPFLKPEIFLKYNLLNFITEGVEYINYLTIRLPQESLAVTVTIIWICLECFPVDYIEYILTLRCRCVPIFLYPGGSSLSLFILLKTWCRGIFTYIFTLKQTIDSEHTNSQFTQFQFCTTYNIIVITHALHYIGL